MFVIVYSKLTKKIVHYRIDYSVPQTLTAEQCFDIFIKDNKLSKEEYELFKIDDNYQLDIVIGNHIFNEDTKQIEEDKNYVQPVSKPIIETEIKNT